MKVIFKNKKKIISTLEMQNKELKLCIDERVKEIFTLEEKNIVLEEENKKLKAKVEHLENIIKMKNQEENMVSIYDEYLYGPKDKEGE